MGAKIDKQPAPAEQAPSPAPSAQPPAAARCHPGVILNMERRLESLQAKRAILIELQQSAGVAHDLTSSIKRNAAQIAELEAALK